MNHLSMPLRFNPYILIRQFASYCSPFGRGSKILCAPLSWLLCLGMLTGGAFGQVYAQNTASLDIDVLLEPGQQFEAGWIITSPRFSSNLTYPMVFDDLGNDVFNELTPYQGFCFEHHPDGRLSWFASAEGYWEVLDSALQVASVVEFQGANPDFHDMELQDNGNALVFGQEIVVANVVDSVPDPTEPDRSVIDCLIQEQDSMGNVIWSWSGLDHIPPTWCTHCNWQASLLDAYHHNAFQTLANGDILLCLRNMDLVVRIDKATGEIIWSFGGPFSDFVLAPESEAFKHPHDAQLIGGNHLILFDNGTGKPEMVSRGVEYALDFDSGVATQVQEWVHPDGAYASSQGSIQRLPAGGTLISWGTAVSEEFGGGMITEYTAEGALSGSIYFPANHFTYRARKVPTDGLPLRQGCRDDVACNYDPLAVLDGTCAFPGEACDDGNPCTENDAVGVGCECQGTWVDPLMTAGCSDPLALNFDPCLPPDVDLGTCQYQVEFRADATAMDSLPEAVTLLIENSAYALTPGGFGTWTGSLLLGNGTWNYQYMADGEVEPVQRTLLLPWPLSVGLEEQRGCIGLDTSVCPGCNDPDNAAFSPFAAGDELCADGALTGCTAEGAVNYSSGAIFDDGSCQFTTESSCPQDLDGDGIVGVADVLQLLTFFGSFCP